MKLQQTITNTIIAVAVLLAAACNSKSQGNVGEQQSAPQEDKEAKRLLQGIWIDQDTEEVTFRAIGDTIFYPDTISQPAYFKIIGDSLILGEQGASYPIVKQTANIFCFRNQNGEDVTLQKSDDPAHVFAFAHEKPQVLTYTEVVKYDSVVNYNGERYHWYLAINPTKYKVHATTYNENGVEVDNTYYDNIMHVSVFRGAQKIFSTDFKKQLFSADIPHQFLQQALLSNMEFTGVDASGFHFVATICKPDGAACYKAENIVSFDGKLKTNLIEY